MDAGTVEGALVMRDMATQVIARVETSLIALQRQFRSTQKTVDGAGTSFEATIANLRKTGDQLSSLGMKMSFALTMPLVAGAAAVTKLASEYESNVVKLQTLSGVLPAQAREFAAAMRTMGKDTGQGPVNLSRAMLVVTSTGMKGAEALDILRKSAQATSVGLGETKDVARALTSVMTAYGKENMSAATTMDQLYQTVVEGGAEATNLAGALGRVIGVVSASGVSFAQAGAYIATFTRLGISAEEAVTSLRAVMGNILSPTQEAQKALAKLGMSAGQFRDMVQNKGLMQTLLDLQKAFKGDVSSMEALFGNIRALAGVLGTTGKQAEEYAGILDRIQGAQGKFGDAVSQASQTMSWTWATVKAEAESTAIAIGEALAPAVGAVLRGFQSLLPVANSLVQAFAGLPRPMQTAVGALLAFAAAVGPITFLVGKLIQFYATLLGSKAVMGLVNSIPVLTARIWLLNAAQAAAAVSARAVAAAETYWAGTSLVMGARLGQAGMAAKALAVSQKATGAVSGALAGLLTVVGSNATVMGVKLAGARAAGVLAGSGMVALGTALIALKVALIAAAAAAVFFGARWLALKALDWSFLEDGTKRAYGVADAIEYASLKMQRFLGIISMDATDADLWNSVMAGRQRREATGPDSSRAEQLKTISDQLKGVDIAQSVTALADAYTGLTAAEKKNPNVMKRTAEQARMLQASGGKLPQVLLDVVKAMSGGELVARSYTQQMKEAQASLDDFAKNKPDLLKQMQAAFTMGTDSPSDIASRLNIPVAVVELYKGQLEKIGKANDEAARKVKDFYDAVSGKTAIDEGKTAMKALEESGLSLGQLTTEARDQVEKAVDAMAAVYASAGKTIPPEVQRIATEIDNLRNSEEATAAATDMFSAGLDQIATAAADLAATWAGSGLTQEAYKTLSAIERVSGGINSLTTEGAEQALGSITGYLIHMTATSQPIPAKFLAIRDALIALVAQRKGVEVLDEQMKRVAESAATTKDEWKTLVEQFQGNDVKEAGLKAANALAAMKGGLKGLTKSGADQALQLVTDAINAMIESGEKVPSILTDIEKRLKKVVGTIPQTKKIEDSFREMAESFRNLATAAGETGLGKFANTVSTVSNSMLVGYDAGVRFKGVLDAKWSTKTATANILNMTTAIVQMAAALDQATQSSSHWANAISGAATGAAAGAPYSAATGGMSVLAGAAIGGIYGYYKSTPEDDVTAAKRDEWLASYGGAAEFRRQWEMAGASVEDWNIAMSAGVDQMEQFQEATKNISAKIQAHTKEIQGLTAAAGGVATMAGGISDKTTQKQFDRIGTYAAGLFGSLLRETGSLSQALEALGGTLDAIVTARDTYGLVTTGAMNEMLGFRNVLAGSPDLAARLSGLEGISAMGVERINATGLLQPFSEDLADLFSELTGRGGATESQALSLMQPLLQTLFKSKLLQGDLMDPSAAALLALAQGKGLVGDNLRNNAEQQVTLLTNIRDILSGQYYPAAETPPTQAPGIGWVNPQ